MINAFKIDIRYLECFHTLEQTARCKMKYFIEKNSIKKNIQNKVSLHHYY